MATAEEDEDEEGEVALEGADEEEEDEVVTEAEEEEEEEDWAALPSAFAPFPPMKPGRHESSAASSPASVTRFLGQWSNTTKLSSLFLLATTRRSVKRKRWSCCLLTAAFLPKVSLAAAVSAALPLAPSFHQTLVTSPLRTSQRLAEMSGTALETSRKSSLLLRMSISSMRSMLRADSLHWATS